MAVPTIIAVAEGGGRSAILEDLEWLWEAVLVVSVGLVLMLGLGRRDEAAWSVFRQGCTCKAADGSEPTSGSSRLYYNPKLRAWCL